MNIKPYLMLLSVLLATGCATFKKDEKVEQLAQETEDMIKEIKESPNYSIVEGAFEPLVAVSTHSNAEDILSDKYIELDGSGIPFSEILKEFEAEGIQVITTLESIRTKEYTGYKIHRTDAATALDMITSNMGFDYELSQDSLGNPVVTITGLQAEEFVLSLPPFKTGFYLTGGVGGGQGGQGGSANGNQGNSQSGGNTGGNNQSGGNSTGGQSDGGIGSSDTFQTMGNKVTFISSESDFYKNLKTELQAMVTEMRPVSINMDQDNSNLMQMSGLSDYVPATVGRVSVNESTGRIEISAPKHIRKRVIKYLRTLEAQLNTRLMMEGRLYSVVSQGDEVRGIDWSDFSNFSGDRFNVFVGNPVLGGGDVTLNSGLAGGVTGTFNDALTDTFIGFNDVEKTFNAFSAYMARDNEVTIVDELSEVSYSGIPASAFELDDNFSTIYSQSATVSGDAGTSGGGVTPQIINRQTGNIIQLTPVYDPRTGIIRTFANISLRLDNGVEPITSIITTADGSERLTSNLTKIKNITMQNVAVQRTGETIILASKTRSYESQTSSGVTGLKDTKVGGLVGKGEKNLYHSKFYFLLNIRAIPYTDSI